jgi:hypothetical protein
MHDKALWESRNVYNRDLYFLKKKQLLYNSFMLPNGSAIERKRKKIIKNNELTWTR